MSRKKNILMASACIVLGMALAGPAAHAAVEILTAVRSTHQFYLDGEQIQLEAYLINGNTPRNWNGKRKNVPNHSTTHSMWNWPW